MTDAHDTHAGKPSPQCATPATRFADVHGARLAYDETDGPRDGRPIVLVHPIQVGAGAHHMRPLFEYLARAGRRVYAVDLPGFGRSDHDERVYDDAHFADGLTQFLRTIEAERWGGASIVAMNLSCEIAARVAIESPSLVSSMMFLSPTGLSERKRPPRAVARLRLATLSLPMVRRSLYSLVSARTSLRFQLARSLAVPVPSALMDDLLRAVATEGAERASLAVLAGLPFHPRPFEELYRLVTKPTLIVYDRDPRTSFERLAELVRANPWFSPIHLPPSGGLSTYEHPATLAALVIQQLRDSELDADRWAARASWLVRHSWAA